MMAQADSDVPYRRTLEVRGITWMRQTLPLLADGASISAVLWWRTGSTMFYWTGSATFPSGRRSSVSTDYRCLGGTRGPINEHFILRADVGDGKRAARGHVINKLSSLIPKQGCWGFWSPYQQLLGENGHHEHPGHHLFITGHTHHFIQSLVDSGRTHVGVTNSSF